jgi:uncharacterized protein YdaU (DUF1376 family)
MAALPYMPLYVADYLADTAHLTVLEHGAYLLLIMNYWQRGKPLPSDDERLARIARVSGEEWARIRPVISEFFAHAGTVWTHDRIEAELAKVRDKSTKARAAGQRSAAVRLAPVQQTLNERSTDAEQTLNHTDTDTDTERKKDISVDFRKTAKTRPMQNAAFEKFWNAYPKRDGANPRMPAFKKFDAKVRAGADPVEIEAGAVAYARAMVGKDPQFVAQAVTWLNQDRWKDHTGPPVQPVVYTKPPMKILTEAEIEAFLLEEEAKEDARNNSGELPAGSVDMRKVASA